MKELVGNGEAGSGVIIVIRGGEGKTGVIRGPGIMIAVAGDGVSHLYVIRVVQEMEPGDGGAAIGDIIGGMGGVGIGVVVGFVLVALYLVVDLVVNGIYRRREVEVQPGWACLDTEEARLVVDLLAVIGAFGKLVGIVDGREQCIFVNLVQVAVLVAVCRTAGAGTVAAGEGQILSQGSLGRDAEMIVGIGVVAQNEVFGALAGVEGQ